MAISFPRNDIMDLLRPLDAGDFRPIRRDSVARTARQTFAAELGDPLWTATIQSEPMGFSEAMALQAALESLRGPMRSAYIYDARMPYPQSAPGGGFSDSASINDIQNGNEMRLSNLGTALAPGDYLAFDWGSGPARALHRVLEAVGAGSTAWFTVEPIILGSPGSANVTLKKPAMEAVLTDGFEPRQVGPREMQFTTTWVQVIT